jgi:para-nitrobenzyl esterase
VRYSIFLLAVIASMAVAAIPEPVRLDSGMVSGVATSKPGIRAFKGIPFAAPPVGSLRWRAPHAVAHWDGVRSANHMSAACPQNSTRPLVTNEDCLHLNVWTPAASAGAGLPVMVWIPGGGWRGGSAAMAAGNEESLAGKGVVVVTLNYRLGALGFLSYPELTKESGRNASGNYGLLDQIAALQWVQRNIAGFGGDPKKVTIFGTSAGGYAVSFLMASPLAKGLFRSAIGECGGAFDGSQLMSAAEQDGAKFAQALGVKTLAEMRAKTAPEVLKAGGIFRPVVDGYFLPSDVYSIFSQGKQNDVPVLTGSNSDEATILPPPPNSQAFQGEVRRLFGDMTEGFLKLYPAATDQQAVQSFLRSRRDQTASSHWAWAKLETKTGTHKAYLYYFAHPPAYPPGTPNRGASHAVETRYVWDNLTPPDWPWTDLDRKLAKVMSSYWVNFATNGDPNGKGLPVWRAYSEPNPQVMYFGDEGEMEPLPNRAELTYLDGVHATHRNAFSMSNSWDWTRHNRTAHEGR